MTHSYKLLRAWIGCEDIIVVRATMKDFFVVLPDLE